MKDENKHENKTLKFLNQIINFRDETLLFNKSPMTVPCETPITKVHFLLTMLGIHTIFIVDNGKLKGFVTKECLLKLSRGEVNKSYLRHKF